MPDLITIAGHPKPLSWSLVISAKSHISTLQARFDEALGSDPTPVVSYAGDPFPYRDGRFQLGVVDTDRIRSSAHPQGVLEVHDASLYAGTIRGADRLETFHENVGSMISSSPTLLRWQGFLTRYESEVNLTQKIASALADLQNWDRVLRRLFTDFQIMVPEGDPSQLVCTLDPPTSPTLIPRVLSHRWRRDYSNPTGIYLGVSYLDDGDQRFLTNGQTGSPLREIGRLQYDLGSAFLELDLQEFKRTAANREATAEVALPEKASELAALMPGRGVVIDGIGYWITQIDLSSQSDVLAMDLREPAA